MPDTTIAANVRKVADSWPGITRVSGQSKVRPIAGTNNPSEHVFGNALDIYGSRNAMSSLAAHLNANKSQLGIRIVCYDGGPGPTYDRCTTKHIDHIHTDMVPNCGGIVSTGGSAKQRRDACEQHQQGKSGGGLVDTVITGQTWEYDPVTGQWVQGEDAPLANALNITGKIEELFTTGLYVLIGAVCVVVGVVLVTKETQAYKTVTGAVKTAVTKGAA